MPQLLTDVDANSVVEGFQACLIHAGGEQISIVGGARGNGTSVAESDVYSVYCAGKPLLAVAVLAACSRGLINLRGPIAEDLLPKWACGTTVEQVLTHTAGLEALHPVLTRFVAPATRDELVREMVAPERQDYRRSASYSAYAGWHILGKQLERACGCSVEEALRFLVLEPYDLLGLCGLSGNVSSHVQPNAWRSTSGDLPLWGEVYGPGRSESNAALGYYASALGLARFYHSVLDDIGGANRVLSSDIALTATMPNAGGFSAVLGRGSEFGLGFMTCLTRQGIDDLVGPNSFGHTGEGGGCIGFGDRDSGIAGCLLLTRLDDDIESVRFRRQRVVEALIRGF